MITLAGAASWSLIVIALVNLLLLGGLVYLVFMVRSQFRKLQEQAQPVISEAQATLAMVRQTGRDVTQRVEMISARVENVAADLTQRVEAVSARAEGMATQITERVEHVSNDVTQRFEAMTNDVMGRFQVITNDVTDNFGQITSGATHTFDRIASDFTERAEHVIDLTDRLVERIAERVDTTTSVVEEAIARPMVGLAGLRAGVNKGLEVWRGYKDRGDGRRGEPEEERHEQARRMVETSATVVSPAGPDIDG